MKKITYQVENWFDCKKQMEWLYPIHWEEVALNKNSIPLKMWFDEYDRLAEMGVLHIVTARDDDKIVGYYWGMIRFHLHYADSLTAFTDMFYLHPKYRKGFNGYKLIKFFIESVKAKGVQRVISNTKIHLDTSVIFKRLGFVQAETVHTKVIG
jgi:GNAT superfamily N-acetyltransferase